MVLLFGSCAAAVRRVADAREYYAAEPHRDSTPAPSRASVFLTDGRRRRPAEPQTPRPVRRFLALAVLAFPLSIGAQTSGSASAAPKPLVFDTALVARADSGRILGSDKAKVWVIIFSDFQCPYCKAWHDQVDAALRKDYVNTGKVRVAFLNFPLPMHKNAQPAADAAMCAASQRKFWAFHDALFATQEQWAQLKDPTASFESAGQKAGLDMTQQRACVAQAKARVLIDADAGRGVRAGVNSTPSFFIGDTAVAGLMPAAEFTKIVDMMLAKKASGAAK